jgi:hypothetical protein
VTDIEFLKPWDLQQIEQVGVMEAVTGIDFQARLVPQVRGLGQSYDFLLALGRILIFLSVGPCTDKTLALCFLNFIRII